MVNNMSTNKEELILDVSLQLFAEKGYDATRMPEIVKAAGIGAGTVYRYFPSKEELFNKLFQRSMDYVFTHFHEKYPKDGTIEEKFSYIFAQGEKLIEHDRMLIYFITKNEFNPALNEESQKKWHCLVSFLFDFIQEGQNEGVFKKVSVDVLIAILYGAFTYTIDFITHNNYKNCEGEPRDFHDIFQDMKITCWDAFRII